MESSVPITEIRPQTSLFSLHLKDIWVYRDLLRMYIKRDIVTFYKQTVLGPLWFVIQPVLTTLMFMFVFRNLAGISTDGIPQPLFYFSGIILWNYFSDCLTRRCLWRTSRYLVKSISLVWWCLCR